MATVAGCDQGSELDAGTAELTAEDLDIELKDAIDAEDEDATGTARDHQTVQVLASADDPSAASIATYSGRSVLQTDTLVDGDVVMLRSLGQGYLGCDDSGAIQANKAPSNTDGRLWRVHLVDLDGDGDDEMQFELVDGEFTDTYLKMNNLGVMSCGNITGIGDAAGWNWGDWYGQSGTVYRRVSRSLVNYKQDLCVHSTGSVAGAGGLCNHNIQTLFNMEILDTAVL
ncbi:MAG: hypothetical protein AAF799_25875 [Myxococcota bacterium]